MVGGISGSYWATPTMKVKYKDDDLIREKACYFTSDNSIAKDTHERMMKEIKQVAGGSNE